MKLTLEKIVVVNEEINTILTKELNVRLSWKISKFKLKLHEIVNLIREKKNDLIKKYGEEIGDSFKIEEGMQGWNEYLQQHKELFSTEEEVGDFSLSIKDLENLELSPKFFINMGDLITE